MELGHMLCLSHGLQLDRKEREWRLLKAGYTLKLFCIVDMQDSIYIYRGVGYKHHKLSLISSVNQIYPPTEEVNANILAQKDKKRRINKM